MRFLKLFEKFWSCKCSRLCKKFWLRHFGRSIYSKNIHCWYWWHWFEFCWSCHRFLIELIKYVLMFLVILNFVSDFWLKEFLAVNYFFLRPIYGQSSNWGCWFWWCWFDLISFNTTMTAFILILSQMFDWKNFWRSTFYFLRSI